MGTKIITCNCISEFQDKLYGDKKRVHNLSFDSKKCTCTVCGNVKLLKEEKVK